MATKKVSKSIPKKPAVKKAELKKPAKKASPVKKAAGKQILLKKQVSGKVVASTKSAFAKLSKPVKKSTPVKKILKSVVKKPAAKKSPISKKGPVVVKKITQPIVKKQSPLVKSAPKKEEKKAAAKVPKAIPLPKAKNIKKLPLKSVVLPKIITTKARKYEPEFTKSVLDQVAPENNGPTMRYSDTELNEFRELIQRKLETAKKELGYLQGLITRKDEMGGDETDNRYMTMEDGGLSMEREQLSQMASRQITFIDHLEKAMMRIENKTYGICRVTGKLIDKARLRAVPHATLSIEAKMGIVK
ncbi:MAG: TraR/DksA C4-type zinc finger protein [Ginsengibacter sp.]